MNPDGVKVVTEKPAGEAPEKGPTMMDKAGGVAISAKDSVVEAGKQVQAKTQGAVDYVKDAVTKK